MGQTLAVKMVPSRFVHIWAHLDLRYCHCERNPDRNLWLASFSRVPCEWRGHNKLHLNFGSLLQSIQLNFISVGSSVAVGWQVVFLVFQAFFHIFSGWSATFWDATCHHRPFLLEITVSIQLKYILSYAHVETYFPCRTGLPPFTTHGPAISPRSDPHLGAFSDTCNVFADKYARLNEQSRSEFSRFISLKCSLTFCRCVFGWQNIFLLKLFELQPVLRARGSQLTYMCFYSTSVLYGSTSVMWLFFYFCFPALWHLFYLQSSCWTLDWTEYLSTYTEITDQHTQ